MKRTIVMVAAAVAVIAGSIGGAVAMGNPEVPGQGSYSDQSDDYPEDETVCYWDGERWLSAFSGTYGGTCTFGR